MYGTAKLLVDGFSTKITRVRRELRVVVYPSSIDLSSRTLRHLTRQLAAHRRETVRRAREETRAADRAMREARRRAEDTAAHARRTARGAHHPA